ncbi:hypothetical protein FXN63_24505 [Pigmentiphaga aceris]|uniref:YbjN domain-containing protein n=2 Tax=Pigmentiphaga aceris TaxID=1940612 RepID=A0A5C0B6M3_9BURK|nr:hypothetical protein FXN63_24505 [Pigmentiphaga aceris]
MVDKTKLAELYQRVVQEELGLVATIDEDDDVVFKHPDVGTMFFSLDADRDPEFLRLVFPRFVDAEELGITPEQLYQVLNTVNTCNKAAKVYINHQGSEADAAPRVSASIEAFVAAPDNMPDEALLRAIVGRTVAALRSGANEVIDVASDMAQPKH